MHDTLLLPLCSPRPLHTYSKDLDILVEALLDDPKTKMWQAEPQSGVVLLLHPDRHSLIPLWVSENTYPFAYGVLLAKHEDGSPVIDGDDGFVFLERVGVKTMWKLRKRIKQKEIQRQLGGFVNEKV